MWPAGPPGRAIDDADDDDDDDDEDDEDDEDDACAMAVWGTPKSKSNQHWSSWSASSSWCNSTEKSRRSSPPGVTA
jgi:hypothetical protein